jgi:hypothetical protein
MITVTNGEIINSQAELAKLASLDGLPTKVSYWLGRTITKLGQLLKHYEAERQRLISAYGPKNEEGKVITSEDGTVVFEGDNAELFAKEYNELFNMELTINSPKITLDDLGNTSLSPKAFVVLGWLIDGVDEEVEPDSSDVK